MVPCKICGVDTTDEFCGYCGIRVVQFIATNQNHSTMNIQWGAGKIGWKEARMLLELIRGNDIKDVLEFGTGLSTEIMNLSGVKIVSCDTYQKHIEEFSKLEPLSGWSHVSKMFNLISPKVDFIWYETNKLPDFDSLYPGKRWDLVVVDGPHQRDFETEEAMRLSSKFIYLHDAGMSKFDHTLTGFEMVDDRLWRKM